MYKNKYFFYSIIILIAPIQSEEKIWKKIRLLYIDNITGMFQVSLTILKLVREKIQVFETEKLGF